MKTIRLSQVALLGWALLMATTSASVQQEQSRTAAGWLIGSYRRWSKAFDKVLRRVVPTRALRLERRSRMGGSNHGRRQVHERDAANRERASHSQLLLDKRRVCSVATSFRADRLERSPPTALGTTLEPDGRFDNRPFSSIAQPR